jgi:RHS repeat-associated protein
VNYNTMDKPTLIVTADKTIGYQYGMGGSRFKRTDTDGGTTQTTLYVGNVEFISTGGVSSEIQRQIEGVALETYYPATTIRKLQYLHHDHLGSIDLITNDLGTVVQKFSYDAWGQRRDAGTFMTGSFSTVDRAISFQMGNFKRGFTGHEHIDDAGLIHMNGRVYDARLARFMSADPLVSAGDNLQAYNRYSYVWNNPLNATDPSGYEPVSGTLIAIAAVIGAEASYAIYIASQIYSVYSIVQGVYGAIQAFKYDQGLGGVLALAQAAYSGYNLYNAGGWGKASWEANVSTSGKIGRAAIEADKIMADNANAALNGATNRGGSLPTEYSVTNINSKQSVHIEDDVFTMSKSQIVDHRANIVADKASFTSVSYDNAMAKLDSALRTASDGGFSAYDLQFAALKINMDSASSQGAIAAGAGFAVLGVAPLVEGGAAALSVYRTFTPAQKAEVWKMTNRGAKKFIKEFSKVAEETDILSGGLQMPKYGTQPLPRPPYQYVSPKP